MKRVIKKEFNIFEEAIIKNQNLGITKEEINSLKGRKLTKLQSEILETRAITITINKKPYKIGKSITDVNYPYKIKSYV